MKKWSRLVFFVLLLAALLVVLAACGGGEPSGKALVQERCLGCHDSDPITGASYSPIQWEYVVDRMITRGAQLDETERDIVIEYLAAEYP